MCCQGKTDKKELWLRLKQRLSLEPGLTTLYHKINLSARVTEKCRKRMLLQYVAQTTVSKTPNIWSLCTPLWLNVRCLLKAAKLSQNQQPLRILETSTKKSSNVGKTHRVQCLVHKFCCTNVNWRRKVMSTSTPNHLWSKPAGSMKESFPAFAESSNKGSLIHLFIIRPHQCGETCAKLPVVRFRTVKQQVVA